MKSKLFCSLLFILICFSPKSLPNASGDSLNIAGHWQGTLDARGTKLKIVFNINDEMGILKATLDSPDQGAMGIKVDSVFMRDDSLQLNVKVIYGFYKGKIGQDKKSISGKWNQAGYSFGLNLNKVDKVEEVIRPQEPKPPFPYISEDVKYKNESAGLTLAGTITLPKSGGPFPAVILITGSGAQNRNEELVGHKPFLVISDFLTRSGIAVLRVDDRGVGESTGNFAAATTKDFATDVLAGIEYLKTREEIEKNKIGLIGHSEGGIIAPMVAAESKDVAFIILMAGTGYPGYKIIIDQTKLIALANGAKEEDIDKEVNLDKKLYEIIKSAADSLTVISKFKTEVESFYNSLSDEDKKKAGGDSKIVFEYYSKTLLSPWFKFFLFYDPAPALEKVKCPVLAIGGSKDLQVPAEENLAIINSSLKKGGNKNYETVLLPGLNHLFQHAETGSPSEYSKIEETISPDALKLMRDWILKTAAEIK